MQEMTHDNAFWLFATQLYQRADVAEYLLSLQHDYRLDIVLLLFLLWLDKNRSGLNAKQFDDVMAIAACWQPILQHARAFRRRLKAQDGGCYCAMKQAELRLEKCYMHALYNEHLPTQKTRYRQSNAMRYIQRFLPKHVISEIQKRLFLH